MLKLLKGMQFIIYDKLKDSVFSVRDRFGMCSILF